jgi:hypothetical protein
MMEKELPTKLIAERVVDLLSEKKRESLKEAVALLESFFANQTDRVARAYELAWLVVLKRGLSQPIGPAILKPAPEADWLALRASRALDEGKIAQAFSLLRTANNTGARTTLCRSVVFQMMRLLPDRNRITHMDYETTKFGVRGITTVEIGRVTGEGLVVIRNPGSKYDLKTKGWKRAEGEDKGDFGRIFVKSAEDLKEDVANGFIEYSTFGASLPAFERIDWSQYLRELCNSKGQDARDAAA